MEKICSTCLEKSYEQSAAGKPEYRKLLTDIAIGGCVIAVLFFVPQALKILNISTLMVKFLLAAGAVLWGTWQSLRHHNWRTLFFWMIYAPLLVTVGLWLLTSKTVWEVASLGCCGVVVLSRKFQAYSARV